MRHYEIVSTDASVKYFINMYRDGGVKKKYGNG